MKYLLDASALLPLVTRRGRHLIEESKRLELLTTDFAFFEAGNGLWKMATLLKTVSLKDAVCIVEVLKEAASRKLIQVIPFEKLDFPETLEFAHEVKLTFYDASYVILARSLKATLVTEDTKLKKVAEKIVKIETYETFEKLLAKST